MSNKDRIRRVELAVMEIFDLIKDTRDGAVWDFDFKELGDICAQISKEIDEESYE